jgi:hypothetical protein
MGAALLPGCGGGDGVRASSSTARPQPPASSPTTSATTGTASPPAAGAYWPYAKLVRALAGRTLALPRGPVHLDSALLECNGEGAPVKTGTTRRWSRYTCTQTMFQNGADRDVTFEVTILSPTRLSITSPRYGSE